MHNHDDNKQGGGNGMMWMMFKGHGSHGGHDHGDSSRDAQKSDHQH